MSGRKLLGSIKAVYNSESFLKYLSLIKENINYWQENLSESKPYDIIYKL